MTQNAPQNDKTDDSTDDEIPELDAYPAGENHEDLLLCDRPDNDDQWTMSDTHIDVMEAR